MSSIENKIIQVGPRVPDAPLSRSDKLTIITTVALFALTIVSAALTCKFFLHPIGHAVAIKVWEFPNIAIHLTIPQIVAGSSLIISSVLLLTFKGSGKSKDAFSKFYGSLNIASALTFMRGLTTEDKNAFNAMYELVDSSENISSSDTSQTMEAWLEELLQQNPNSEAEKFLRKLQQDRINGGAEGSIASKFLNQEIEEYQITDCFGPLKREYDKLLVIPTINNKPMEIVSLKTADGVPLKCFWHQNDPQKPVVILFHGNAMHGEDIVPLAQSYAKRGLNVLIVEYRGTGINEGARDRAQAYNTAQLDADAGYFFARFGITDLNPETLQQQVKDKENDQRQVLIHGHSLGAAVAAGLADRMNEPFVGDHLFDDPVNTVINNSNYKIHQAIKNNRDKNGSLKEKTQLIANIAFRNFMWLFKPLANLILGIKEQSSSAWKTTEKVKNLKKAKQFVYLIGGTNDSVVPADCVKTLAATCHLNKKEYQIDNTAHSYASDDDVAKIVERAVGEGFITLN